MAKQIKTIKCPQCGSVQKTEIRPDHFRCGSCGTEYFLDDDDVNVNIRHTYSPERDSPPQGMAKSSNKKAVLILLIIVAALILITLYIPVFMAGMIEKSGTIAPFVNDNYSPLTTVYESTPVEIDGKPYIVCYGTREKRNDSGYEQQLGYYFYDVEQDKRENYTVIEGITERKDNDMRSFADGSCYLSINKKFIYRLNKETMLFEDYMPHIRETDKAFSTGVASIEITYPRDGDAFDIMSNIGNEYKYYPIVDRVYTEDDAYRAGRGMRNLLPGARDSTYYLFTEASFFGNHPVQLFEVTFRYNAGGPMDFIEKTEYGWQGDGDGFFSSYDRIAGYRDVTPGRRWFDAHIANMGRGDLLVSVRATAAEDSQVSIQKIDTATGEVVWSTPVPSPERGAWGHLEHSIRVGDRYLIKADHFLDKYLVLDADGNFLKEIVM